MTIFLQCFSACITEGETTVHTTWIFYIQIALATVLDFLVTIYLGIVLQCSTYFLCKIFYGKKMEQERPLLQMKCANDMQKLRVPFDVMYVFFITNGIPQSLSLSQIYKHLFKTYLSIPLSFSMLQ